MLQKRRENKGCFGVKDRVLHKIRDFEGRDKFLFKTCIGNFYNPSASSWLRLQSSYERGVMPFPGSHLDQPAKAIEIFQVVEEHKTAKMIQEQQKLDQERRRNGR